MTTADPIKLLAQLEAFNAQLYRYIRTQTITEIKARIPGLISVSLASHFEHCDDGTYAESIEEIILEIRSGETSIRVDFGAHSELDDIGYFLENGIYNLFEAAAELGHPLSNDQQAAVINAASENDDLDPAFRAVLDPLGIGNFDQVRELLLTLIAHRDGEYEFTADPLPTFEGFDPSAVEDVNTWLATVPCREVLPA